MADIFISYANEDRDRAAQVAAFLESVGWSVWWDRRIPAGRSWRSLLEEALVGMRCMVVLWSEHSVKSPWVVEEAEEARRLGKTIVPVLIQRVEPPIGFRAIQAADLVDWDASPEDPAARVFIADLKSLLGSRDKKPDAVIADLEAPETGRRVEIFSWVLSHWRRAALGALIMVVFVAAWQYWAESESEVCCPAGRDRRFGYRRRAAFDSLGGDGRAKKNQAVGDAQAGSQGTILGWDLKVTFATASSG